MDAEDRNRWVRGVRTGFGRIREGEQCYGWPCGREVEGIVLVYIWLASSYGICWSIVKISESSSS
jgi:hypothetical protein